MKDVFKKPKFGQPPAGYVPGVGRGAVPIFTRSDIGDPSDPNSKITPTSGTRGHEYEKTDFSDTAFDKFYGFNDSALADQQYTKEDQEADQIFDQVEAYMQSRKKHRKTQEPTNKGPVPSQILKDAKKELVKVSKEEWDQLPDPKAFGKKRGRRQNYLPISDRVIKTAYEENKLSSGVVSGVRSTVISAKLDNTQTGSLSLAPSVDPQGYLTQMDSMRVSSVGDSADLSKIRNLIKSLIESNRNNPEAWLAASRLEEKDNNLKAAKKILEEACQQCPDSEDLWIEAARLETLSKAKHILTKGATFIPKSVKIWMALSAKEQNPQEKEKVLRKGLEFNPDSVKLWKEVVSVCQEEQAKAYLKKAVTCCPYSVDLWLALARLEEYKNARAVLNQAFKKIPTEPKILISAARLEDTQGNTSNVEKLIDRSIRTLSKKGVPIVRKDWLKEAAYASEASNLLTAKAIVQQTLHTGLEEDQKLSTWLEDLQSLTQEGHYSCARIMVKSILEIFPKNPGVWRFAVDIEKHFGELVKETYIQAFERTEDFWEEALEYFSDLATLQEIYQKVLSKLHNNPKTYLVSAKIEKRSGNLDKALELLYSGVKTLGTSSLRVKAAKYLQLQGKNHESLELLKESLELFPKVPEFYLLIGNLTNIVGTLEALKILEKGMLLIPESPLLYTKASKLNELQKNTLKARVLLEKARKQAPSKKSYLASINFELRQKNPKYALSLVSSALKDFPDLGKAWALKIHHENHQKSLVTEALQYCENCPYVLLEAAKVFWKQGKLANAKEWFAKALEKGKKVGDVWIWWYAFQKENGEPQKVLEEANQQVIKHGTLWKAFKSPQATNTEIIQCAADNLN